MLLVLLLKFEELFDGTLGDWKLLLVSFELKEGAKPYHGRPYPIPKIHKATLMKEIDCLISIGVLKWQPFSVGLAFFHHSKEGPHSAYDIRF